MQGTEKVLETAPGWASSTGACAAAAFLAPWIVIWRNVGTGTYENFLLPPAAGAEPGAGSTAS